MYEYQCELQLWNKVNSYYTLVHACAVMQNVHLAEYSVPFDCLVPSLLLVAAGELPG